MLFLLTRRDLRMALVRRFFPPDPENSESHIWFHAASAGEARQAAALACLLKEKNPDIPLLITSNTASGLAEARRHCIFDRLLAFPLDMPFSLSRIFGLYKPRLLVLIESEYWPGLLRRAEKHGIPAIAANARLSNGTGRFFSMLNMLSGGALKQITFAAADESERSHLLEAGVPAENLHVCGNLKVDMFISEISTHLPKTKSNRPVWLAASTHKGENEILLKAFKEIRKSRPGLRLLIAPRHIERASEILELAKKFGFSAEYSESTLADKADVEVINGFGRLAIQFTRADLVFVGGSLLNHGGHNLLEPIMAGKPLFYGPHIQRWQRWSDMLVKCGAARIVHDEQEIEGIFADFLDNSLEKSDSVERAQKMLEVHRGALARNADLISEKLERGRALGD